MALGEHDIRIVMNSVPMIRQAFRPLSMDFYNNLFAIAPEMRPLFRDDIASQGMRFISTLTTIADLLDDPEMLETELAQLARAHARVGVRMEHFRPMGSALLVTMGETLGPRFTTELQAAWRAAYDWVAEEMIRRGGFSESGDGTQG